jgi:hypothetical protein
MAYPTWVLKSGVTTYIAQATTLNTAITLIKTQYPHVGEARSCKGRWSIGAFPKLLRLTNRHSF